MLRGAIEGAIEVGQAFALYQRHRIVGESLVGIFLGELADLDRKAIRAVAVGAIEKGCERIRPSLWRKMLGHLSSPQSLTICRIFAFVVGSIFRYWR